MESDATRHCRNCEDIFKVSREWQLFCSNICRQRWNYREAGFCFYCGEPGEVHQNHIYPVSLRARFQPRNKTSQETVNACIECNNTLGSRFFSNVEARIQFIIDVYTEKYKLNTGVVTWANEEIEELGPGLKMRIKHYLAVRHKSERRIIYLKAIQFEIRRDGFVKEENCPL